MTMESQMIAFQIAMFCIPVLGALGVHANEWLIDKFPEHPMYRSIRRCVTFFSVWIALGVSAFMGFGIGSQLLDKDAGLEEMISYLGPLVIGWLCAVWLLRGHIVTAIKRKSGG